MTPLGREEIEAILPHRPPMLLVDEVLELEPGVRVVALKRVTEENCAGHFPGNRLPSDGRSSRPAHRPTLTAHRRWQWQVERRLAEGFLGGCAIGLGRRPPQLLEDGPAASLATF